MFRVTHFFAALCVFILCPHGRGQEAALPAAASYSPTESNISWACSTPLSNLAETNGGLIKSTTADATTYYRAIALGGPSADSPALWLHQQGHIHFKAALGSYLCVGLNRYATSNSPAADLDFYLFVGNRTVTAYCNGSVVGSAQTLNSNSELYLIRSPDGTISYSLGAPGSGTAPFATASLKATGPLRVEAMLRAGSSKLNACWVAHDDRDGDQLPDGWELAHFDDLTGAAADDPDGDGRSNWDEFRDGTSPRSPRSFARKVRWHNPVNCRTNDLGDSLTRLSNTAAGVAIPAGYTASASPSILGPNQTSLPALLLGEGSVTFEPDAPAYSLSLNTINWLGSVMALGLATPNSSNNEAAITWAFLLAANGNISLKVPESATPIAISGTAGAYHSGSQLRLTRRGNRISFYHDGVLLRESTTDSNHSLQVDCSLHSVNSASSTLASLSRCSLDDGDEDQDGLPDTWEFSFLPPDSGLNDLIAFQPQADADGDGVSTLDEALDGTNPVSNLSLTKPIHWGQLTNTSTTTNEGQSPGNGYLRKSISTRVEVFDADAIATHDAQDDSDAVIAEDGLLSFQASAGSSIVIGFTEENNSHSDSDSDWAFALAADDSFDLIRKHDGSRYNITGLKGTYNANTRFSIQRSEGIITFLKDGMVIYRSTNISSGALIVDCSIKTLASTLTRARLYNGDTDDDNLPDAWELKQFGNLNTQNDHGDPDADGIENGDEYLDGSNPNLPPLRSRNLVWSGINPAANASSTNNGNSITKGSAAASGWNTDATAHYRDDASTLQVLQLGLYGRLSFTASDINKLSLGLTPTDNNRSFTDYEYCVVTTPATASAPGSASIYENGATGSSWPSFKSHYPDTRFSIRRIGGQIEYLKNNKVIYRSKAPATAAAYRIEVALHGSDNARTTEVNEGASLTGARLSSGDVDEDNLPDDWEIQQILRSNPGDNITYNRINEYLGSADPDNDSFNNLQEYQHQTDPLNGLSRPRPVTWTQLTNTSTTTAANTTPGNGYLRKSAGTAAYNADASSNRSLTGDLTLSFRAPPGALAVGLTSSDDNATTADLEYAFTLSASAISLRCPEDSSISIGGTYDANSLFTITRRSGKLSFFKDGLLLYESNTANSNALFADCSLNTLGQTLNSTHLSGDDEDQDGISDSWEWSWLGHNCSQEQWTQFGSVDNDQDNDGLSDLLEYQLKSNPTSSDSDGDGMPDAWEQAQGLALLDPDNALSDADSDGLNQLGEYRAGTDPHNPDCDNDGLPDGTEVLATLNDQHLNPLDPQDAWGDLDGDRIPNIVEYQRHKALNNPAEQPRFDITVEPNPNPDYAVLYHSSISQALGELDNANLHRPRPYYLVSVRSGQLPDTLIDSAEATNNQRFLVLIGEPNIPEQYPTFNSSLAIARNTYFHGFRFTAATDPITIRQSSAGGPQISPQVRMANCLFNRIEPAISSYNPANGSGSPASINLIHGSLHLIHCTLHNCASQAPDLTQNHREGHSLYNASNDTPAAPNLTLTRCLIWTDDQPPLRPIHGNFLNQGSLIGSPSSPPSPNEPQFTLNGHPSNPTAITLGLNNDPQATQTIHLLPRDIFGQTRSLSNPCLGAMEWIDSDMDQLPDWWELQWWSSLNSVAADSIPDVRNLEILSPLREPTPKSALRHFLTGTAPFQDFDRDGLPDWWELQHWGDLNQNDRGNPDNDARNNLAEYNDGTDPTAIDEDFDSDNDGLPDVWEIAYFSASPPLADLDPLRYNGKDDPDEDQLDNLTEYQRGTNPSIGLPTDRDNDGLPDHWERAFFAQAILPQELANPNFQAEPLRFNAADDPDEDQLTNLTEYQQGSDPSQPPPSLDQNHNNLWDWWENNLRNNNNALPERQRFAESELGPDGDPDGDGLSNLQEMLYGSNPLKNEGSNRDFTFYEDSPWLNPLDRADAILVGEQRYRLEASGVWGPYLETPYLRPWSYSTTRTQPGISSGFHIIGSEGLWLLGDFMRSQGFHIHDWGLLGWRACWQDDNGGLYGCDVTYDASRWTCDIRLNRIDRDSKKLIIQAYRTRRAQQSFVLCIPPGMNTHLGNSCLLRVPPMRASDFSANGDARASESLERIPLAVARNLPPKDQAGPRHRKISLNGAPMPDSTPGDKNEESELNDESYVDAYSRQLRLGNTDLYLKRPFTSLPLLVRRDLVPEVWSDTYSLTPSERPDRPFGPGWSSNLCAHIHLEISTNFSPELYGQHYGRTHRATKDTTPKSLSESFLSNSLIGEKTEQLSANELYKEKLANPPRITLTDERGASYSFTDIGHEWMVKVNQTPHFSGFKPLWVPSPDEQHGSKTAYDTLTQIPADCIPPLATGFTLTKRNGTVCTYQKTSIIQVHASNRKSPTSYRSEHYYYRLISVRDRAGNQLLYTYPSDDKSTRNLREDATLIPCTISDPAMADGSISITQSNGRVLSISGPDGQSVFYHFGSVQHAPSTQSLTVQSRGQIQLANTSVTLNLLRMVSRENATPNANEILSSTLYDYHYQSEIDPTPDPTQNGYCMFSHLELSSTTDGNQNTYQFAYELNQNIRYDCWYGTYDYHQTRIHSGLPRLLTQITLPDQSLISFSGNRSLHLQLDLRDLTRRLKSETLNGRQVPPTLSTEVSGPCGHYTYRFSQPQLSSPPQLYYSTLAFVGGVPDGDINENVFFLNFTRLDIESRSPDRSTYYGTETLMFNPQASMALASITDLSGRTTTYQYLDIAPMPAGLPALNPGQLDAAPKLYYDDPTGETTPLHDQPRDPHNQLNAQGQGTHNGFTRHRYNSNRDLIETRSPNGLITRRTYNELGLCTAVQQHETNLLGAETCIASTTHQYNHPTDPDNPIYRTWPSFLYRSTQQIQSLLPTPEGFELPEGAPAIANRITDQLPDRNGRIATSTQYAGPNGTQPLSTNTTYNSAGLPTSITDADGNRTQHEYHPQTQRLIRSTNPDGSNKTLTYDRAGNLTSETNELGVTTRHEYDALNRRIKTTLDLNGNQAPDATYSNATLPNRTETLNTDSPLIEYDGDLLTLNNYNARGQVTRSLSPGNIETLNTYDGIGRLIQTTVQPNGNTDPAQALTTTYSNFIGGSITNLEDCKATSITNPAGIVTTLILNALNQVTCTTLTDNTRPAGEQSITSYRLYNDAGQVVAEINPLGQCTTHTYHLLGHRLSSTLPVDPGETTLTTKQYPLTNGQIWISIDTLGNSTLQYHDGAGRLTHAFGPQLNRDLGDAIDNSRPLTQTTYNGNGKPLRVTNPIGQVTITSYDNRNRPISVTSPSGAITRTTYDATDKVIAVTDPLGRVTQKFYDRAGRLWLTRRPATGTQLHLSSNRLSPDGHILQATTYKTLNGDLIALTTNNLYDVAGRLIQSTDPAGITTRMTYDKAGNRTSLSNGNGTVSFFKYDAQNRLIAKHYAGPNAGSAISKVHRYNALHKISTTDGSSSGADFALEATDQQTTTYTYNARGNLITLAASDLALRHSYDGLGRLLATTQSSTTLAATSNNYSPNGWLLSETSLGRTHRHNYNLAGQRLSSTLDCGNNSTRSLRMTYDADGRLTTLVDDNETPANNADDLSTSYTYDLAGRVITLTQPNGTTTTNTYDALGRLTQRLSTRGPNAITLCSLLLSYDELDNLTQLSETWHSETGRPDGTRLTTLTYDNANRLLSESISHIGPDATTQSLSQKLFTYDQVNNRTSQRITTSENLAGPVSETHLTSFNAANQPTLTRIYRGLLSNPDNSLRSPNAQDELTQSLTYSYDKRGNRTQLIDYTPAKAAVAANGTIPAQPAVAAITKTTTYNYDSQNRLVSCATPSLGSFNYLYDHRTRRLRIQRVNGPNSYSTLSSFAGGLSVAEWTNSGTAQGALPLANPNPATTRADLQYTRGPDMGGGVGGLLHSKRKDANSSTYTHKFNLANGRGDIIAQTDSTGALTWTASYDASGRRPKETGSNADRQRSNSKEEDETGLVNDHHRYRDPVTLSYLTLDPAGFVDGPNLYAYVNQNPWSKFDPEGLWAEAGHFYTTYAVALAAGIGRERAYRIAYYSQLPDEAAQFDAITTANAAVSAVGHPLKQMLRVITHDTEGQKRADMTVRDMNNVHQGMHFLKGSSDHQIKQTRSSLSNAIKEGAFKADWQLGFAIHTLGDTFSHTKDLGNGLEQGYPPLSGHASDGVKPDSINQNAFNSSKYRQYVNTLYISLGGKNADGNKIINALLEQASKISPVVLSQKMPNNQMHEWFTSFFGGNAPLGNYDPRKPGAIDEKMPTPTREETVKHLDKISLYLK